MNSFLTYCLELNLYLTLLFLCYNWGVRKSTHFRFNRSFLLIGIGISLILPSLQVNLNNPVSSQLPSFQLEEIIIIGSATTNPSSSFQLLDWLLIIFSLGLFISLCRISIGVYKIERLKSQCKKSSTHFLIPNSKAAFSFLQHIFIGEDLTEDQKKVALKHEMVHVKQLHHLDLLFVQLLQSFLFYNPIIYKFKPLFRELHEFEADFCSADAKENYIIQLISHQFDIQESILIHQFNSTNLNSRIMRLKNEETRAVRPSSIVMSFLLFTALFTFNQNGQAQNQSEETEFINSSKSSDHESTVDKVAEYPGGNEAIFNYIMENTKYPADAKEKKINGTVYVEFIVSTEGKISSTKVLRGVEGGESLDQEAIRVIESLPKTWTPAQKDGKAVASSTVIPIRFNIPPTPPKPPHPPVPPAPAKAP